MSGATSLSDLSLSGAISVTEVTATDGDVTLDSGNVYAKAGQVITNSVRFGSAGGITSNQSGENNLCNTDMSLLTGDQVGTNDVYAGGGNARTRPMGRYGIFTTNIGTRSTSAPWNSSGQAWTIFQLNASQGLGSMVTICYLNPVAINIGSSSDPISPSTSTSLNPIVRAMFYSGSINVAGPNQPYDNVIARTEYNNGSSPLILQSGFAVFPGGDNYAPQSAMTTGVLPPTGCVEFWPGDTRTFILVPLQSSTYQSFPGIGSAFAAPADPNSSPGYVTTNIASTWLEVTDSYANWGSNRNSASNWPIYES